MKPRLDWRLFLAELAFYTAMVVAYFLLVLHYLGPWLKDLFDHDRRVFATVALLLMIGQAVGLELVSSLAFHFLRRKEP